MKFWRLNHSNFILLDCSWKMINSNFLFSQISLLDFAELLMVWGGLLVKQRILSNNFNHQPRINIIWSRFYENLTKNLCPVSRKHVSMFRVILYLTFYFLIMREKILYCWAGQFMPPHSPVCRQLVYCRILLSQHISSAIL